MALASAPTPALTLTLAPAGRRHVRIPVCSANCHPAQLCHAVGFAALTKFLTNPKLETPKLAGMPDPAALRSPKPCPLNFEQGETGRGKAHARPDAAYAARCGKVGLGRPTPCGPPKGKRPLQPLGKVRRHSHSVSLFSFVVVKNSLLTQRDDDCSKPLPLIPLLLVE